MAMDWKKVELDRRDLLKGLGALAGLASLGLSRATLAVAQPTPVTTRIETAPACPITIKIENPVLKLRRPERKLTLYFDLAVEMAEGQLIEVKRTVRIIRAIRRRFRGEEEILFIPVITRKANMSKEIKGNRIIAYGEENVLIDFENLCYQLRGLNGLAFAVEILIEARGLVPENKICSQNKLVVQNFDVPTVCKF